jgi:hypothetical protein
MLRFDCISRQVVEVMLLKWIVQVSMYSVFQQFGQAKFAYGGFIVSPMQFLLLPQVPQNLKLSTKTLLTKMTQKIIISMH